MSEATIEYSPATKEMGDKIVGLTLKQAKELSETATNALIDSAKAVETALNLELAEGTVIADRVRETD